MRLVRLLLVLVLAVAAVALVAAWVEPATFDLRYNGFISPK